MMLLRLSVVSLCLCLVAQAQVIPDRTSQCVVAITEAWDSTHATLSLHVKESGKWQRIGKSWPTRLGKKGLAWGRGLHPNPKGVTLKQEGDWKSPAGVFSIGGAWGYDASIKKHRKLPYTQITSRHLWVEDAESKHYNRQVVLKHEPKTAWEKKAQMRQNDPAHSLKLFIAHNAPPKVVKGGGSSIFFHIWRDRGGRSTAGCTVMTEADLRKLIASIDPDQQPVYVLLPKTEYQKYREVWGLP